jgi:hypothetical protein
MNNYPLIFSSLAIKSLPTQLMNHLGLEVHGSCFSFQWMLHPPIGIILSPILMFLSYDFSHHLHLYLPNFHLLQTLSFFIFCFENEKTLGGNLEVIPCCDGCQKIYCIQLGIHEKQNDAFL